MIEIIVLAVGYALGVTCHATIKKELITPAIAKAKTFCKKVSQD